MGQLAELAGVIAGIDRQTCLVGAIQSVESAERFFDWICLQNIDRFHLILLHVAQELCAQSLPVSALTASRVIAKKDNQAMLMVACLERLKKRIGDRFPGSTVDCRITNGSFEKAVIAVIKEKRADKLVLTQANRNFPTKKISCSVEFIAHR